MFVSANIFQPLIDVFEQVLLFFHDQIGVGWGVSIILLTVVVRAVLLPLTFKQSRSMQALQRLQPEIKKMQEKYKGDKQRLNQEMMKFYQQNKVNPLGSCLPLAAQMPVFLSLFYMLRKDLKEDICGTGSLAQPFKDYVAQHGGNVQNIACNQIPGAHGSAKFLFIPDLTHAAVGSVLIVLLVLYVASQLGSSLLMSSTIADKNQQRLMLFLPLLFVVFIKGFPAGLLVYWITTNLWTVGQQYMIKRVVGPIRPVASPEPAAAGAPVAALAGGGADAGPAPGSGLLSRKPKPKAQPAAPVRSGPPPSSPRKKKKRSGRRR